MIIRSIFAVLSVGFFPILTFAESVHGQVSIVDEPLVFNEAMLVSGIILAVTFIGIFTEMLHGLERMKVAAGGAIVMVIVGQIYGFYNPSLAVEAVDWNVVFLLGAMMTVIAMMIPTGGFDMLAYRIANFSKGPTVYVAGADRHLCHRSVPAAGQRDHGGDFRPAYHPDCPGAEESRRSPTSLRLPCCRIRAESPTLVGDPPNLMIGSAANILVQ